MSLTPEEWRAYFAGDATNKARVAAVEDVSFDGMHLTDRARFSARLSEAYGSASPGMTRRVDDQVIAVLRQWIDNGSRTPEMTPIQKAWLSWVLYDRQLEDATSLKETTTTATKHESVQWFNVKEVLRWMEESRTIGQDLIDYDKRYDERLAAFRVKVSRYMIDPTEDNLNESERDRIVDILNEIERDPHLQNALRVTKPCGKTAEYTLNLRLTRMARYSGPSTSEVAFYEKQRRNNMYGPIEHGKYLEQRAANRPGFGRLAYFQVI